MRINLIKTRVAKRTAWKALNIVSTLAIVFNTGMVAALINPTVTNAATLGPNNGSTFSNDATVGTIDWSHPSYAQTHDSNRAVADLDDNQISKYLKATNFGFAIPSGATINGIKVEVERKAEDSNRIKDYAAKIIKGGTIGSDNKAGSSFWGTSDSYASYGSSSELWGQTWTPADINASNFGFVLAAKKDTTSGNHVEALVNHVRITVDYTPETPAGPTPAANPVLAQSCGLDIGLLVDTSGSVDSGEMTNMKSALTSFANAFTGTPTVFSLATFSDNSTLRNGFSLTPAQAATAINDPHFPGDGDGWTNWDSGLARSFDTFDPRTAKPNLIVIATDGSPNSYGYNGADPVEPTITPSHNPANSAELAAGLNHAITRANAIKGANTRIVVLGIGNDTSDPATPEQKVDKMIKISGDNVAYTPETITTSTDVIKVSNFEGIGAALSAYSNELCGGKILVQKQFDTNGDGIAEITGSTADPALADWTFDVDGSPSNPAPQTTTNTGNLSFDVLNGTYSVVETNQKPGTSIVNASCVKGTSPIGTFHADTKTISGLSLTTDDTISCNFLNQYSTGSLKVTKVVDSGSVTPDQWSFTLGSQTKSPTSGQNYVVFDGLSAGVPVTVTESTNVPNYHKVSSTCDNVQITAGNESTCVFHNTRDTGTIELKKIWLGTAGQTTLNIGTTANASNVDSQLTGTAGAAPLTTGQNTVNAGVTYYVSENGGLSNYTASLACTDNGTPVTPGANNSVTVAKDHTVVCTFTNTRNTGTIIVHKDVVNPDGGVVTDNHSFYVKLNGGNQKTISENTDATYSNIDTGTGSYSITENLDSDYTLNSCSVAGGTCASFSVTKDSPTHVYLVNKQKKATITISKNVLNSLGADITDTTSFNVARKFQPSGPTVNGSIAEGNQWIMQVNPGTYTFTESSNSNYTTTSDNPKQLTVGSNGQASYTFVNKQKSSSISGKKFEDKNGNGVKNLDENYLDGWEIYLDMNNNDQWNAGEPKVTTGTGSWSDGYYEFTNLTPSTYTVREVGKNGWTQTAPAGNEHVIVLGVNQSVSGKDFGNFELGKIWGYKYEDKNADGNYDNGDIKLNGWTICLNDHNCVVTGAGSWSDGYYEFTNLAHGDYSITEQQVTGWYAIAPQLSGYSVHINSGDIEHKDFFNFKGISVKVTKLMDADGKTSTTGDRTTKAGWTVQLFEKDDGHYHQIGTDKVTGEDGTYTWNNLGPGDYRVKEVFDANAYQALSNTSYDFDAVSGQNKDYTFVNWKRSAVKIVAQKIVCTNEAELPNWGLGGPDITSATAQDWVNSHESCRFASDWNFQWGYDWIANPGDNTGMSENWTTFGPTDGTGTVITEISSLRNNKIWLREAWKDQYIPFSFEQNEGNSNNYSAEFYCHKDVLNYDNYEWIDNLQLGTNGNQPTYYCVGFNVPNQFDVDVTKTADKSVVKAGENVTYTLNWTVTGNTPVDTIITDVIPANTTFVSADNGGTSDGTTVTWNLGTKTPADSGSVTLTVKLNSPLDNGLKIDNTAKICGQGNLVRETDNELRIAAVFDEIVNPKTEKCDEGKTTITVESAPTLGLKKVADPVTIGGNQNVTYTITWSVAGNSKATDVVVNDPIPANTSYVSMACGTTTGTCTMTQTGSPVTSTTWNLGTRNPGEGGTLTLVVKTAISVPNGSVIPNEAKVSAAGIDPIYAKADVKAATAPVLQITKTVNAVYVNPGDPVTYTVKVKNIGTDDAINASLTDTLPAGFTFVEGGTNVHIWALGTLKVGEEKTTTYTVNVGPSVTAGTYANAAKAKADNAAEVATFVNLEVRVPKVLGETTTPVLMIRKTVNKATAAPSDKLTYTVEIKNTGSGEAVHVVLNDVLPLGFTFVDGGGTAKTWQFGNIAVGQTKTISYVVAVGKSVPNGAYENLAIASADNHGKVTASVPVTIKRGRVLGETVETGASLTDGIIALLGASLVALGVYMVRRRKEDGNLA